MAAVPGPSFWGEDDFGGDPRALHLKVYSGEVLQTFDEVNVMEPLLMQKTISFGKTAQFPVTGKITARYHKPGNNIITDQNTDTVQELNRIRSSEKTIAIDSVLHSSILVDELDEKLSHYDSRAIWAHEMGEALAVKFDYNALVQVLKAARTTTPVITGNPAGETITDADFVTNGASAVDTIFTCAQKFDEKDIPQSDRYIVVPPSVWYRLVRQTDLVSLDYNPPGNGSLADGTIMRAAGIRILKSNHIPGVDWSTYNTSTDLGQSAHEFNDYGTTSGNFSTTVAVAFHKSAAGVLKLMDMTVEAEYKIEYQADLLVAKMAIGMADLRPEAAIEIKTA